MQINLDTSGNNKLLTNYVRSLEAKLKILNLKSNNLHYLYNKKVSLQLTLRYMELKMIEEDSRLVSTKSLSFLTFQIILYLKKGFLHIDFKN